MVSVRKVGYILIIFILSHLLEANKRQKLEKVIMIRKYKMCDGPSIVKTNGYTMDVVGRSTVAISVNFTFPYDVEKIDSCVWSCYKCFSPYAEKSACELVLKFPVNNVCKIIKEKNQAWTHTLDSIQPPITCPVRKGNYTVNKHILDSRRIMKLFGAEMGGDYSYLAVAASYVGKKVLHCIEVYFELQTVRT